MSAPQNSLVIKGWTVFAHGCFLNQYELLQAQVSALKLRHPELWMQKNAAKRLATVTHLVLEEILQDPTRDSYRQGKTLGSANKHWFRAKFYQQYRLFFRYHLKGKTIIFGWFNDEKTKRAYDSRTDAYRVFQGILENGNPPNNWLALLSEAQAESERFRTLVDDFLG